MYMKKMHKIFCAGTVMFWANANAGLISIDWKTAGDNLITYDTNTGLNWLDLTETVGDTYL